MEVFWQVHSQEAKKSVLSRIVFGAREAGGLLGAFQEHVRAMTNFPRRMAFSKRRLTMHSEFRFPKATVSLMTIILAAVLIAIDKAKAIQSSIPYANPQVGPIHSTQQLMLLPTLLLVWMGASIAGVVGWAVLFALRRTGVQRLSDVDPAGGPCSGGRLTNGARSSG